MEFGPDTLEHPVGELRALRDLPHTPVDIADRADLAVEDDRLAGTPDARDSTRDRPGSDRAGADRAGADRGGAGSPGSEHAGDPGDESRGPRYLSPSSSAMYEQCPRKWKHRYLDRLPDPPGEAALAGTFAHRVLELLLQLPSSQRTEDEARRLARAVWPEMSRDLDFIALRLDEPAERRFRWRGWQAIQGLWAIESPESVVVHATEHDVKTEIDGVPFRGIIDRVDVDGEALVISDYKSGRAPRPRWVSDKLSQVLLYAAAMRASTGQTPTRARLLYLGQTIIETSVNSVNLGEVTSNLASTWESLQSDCATEMFAASTGPLCAWCPFVRHCAEGSAEVARRHAAGMVRPDAPGLEVLPAAG